MIELRASCFGKLPVHGDFIKVQAGPEGNLLDAFLGQGLLKLQEALGAGWEAAYDAGQPFRFIRFLPRAKKLLCGVLAPSRGKVGRAFPFVLWTALDAGSVRKRPALLPILCDDFLADAEAFVRGGWQGMDLRGVQDSVARLSRAADDKAARSRLDALRDQRTYEDLLLDALGTWDDRRYLLLLNMASLLGPRSRPRFAVVLPPAPGPDDAALWLDLAVDLRGGAGLFPFLAAWSHAEPTRARGIRCTLVEPTPEHFAAVVFPDVKNDACLLYQEGLESASLLDKARARFGAAADRAGQSLGDLSRALQKA